MMVNTTGADQEPSLAQRVVYGLPAMPHAFIASPLYMLLPAFYAANTHVTLAQIGTVAALGRVFDAVCDPIVGFLSDRTRARFGTRKPWAIGSMLFCALSARQLFQPPPDAEVAYFALWSALLYVGFTMFEVPNLAWGAELSRDYAQRSKIGASKAMFNIAGSLSSYMLPIGLYFVTGSTEINASYLTYLSNAYVVLFPACMILALFVVPNGPVIETAQASLGAVLASLRQSGVLRRFYTMTALWGLGQGAMMSLIFIFVTDYMGMKAQFPFIMVALFVAELVFLPVWTPILRKLDRHRAWSLCIGIMALLSPLVLLLPKGEASLVPFMIFALIRSFFSAPTNFLPSAVLGDVIDHDAMKTGLAKAGNFFALQSLVIKATMAAGGAGAFLVLDAVQYKIGGVNGPQAELGLFIAYLGVPIIAHLGLAVVGWNFPITSARHRVIQRRLAARARRLALARQA